MKKLFNFLTIAGISISVFMPVNVQAAQVPILDNQQIHEYLAITQINFSILKRINSTTSPVCHTDNRGKYLQFPAISAVSRGFARYTPGISFASHRQKSLHDRPSYQHQFFDPPPELAEAYLDISSP